LFFFCNACKHTKSSITFDMTHDSLQNARNCSSCWMNGRFHFGFDAHWAIRKGLWCLPSPSGIAHHVGTPLKFSAGRFIAFSANCQYTRACMDLPIVSAQNKDSEGLESPSNHGFDCIGRRERHC
jgi:hypothetical protein